MNAKNEYVPELFVRTIKTNYARICRIPHTLRKNDIPGRKTKRKKHHEPLKETTRHGDVYENERSCPQAPVKSTKKVWLTIMVFSEGGGSGHDLTCDRTGSFDKRNFRRLTA